MKIKAILARTTSRELGHRVTPALARENKGSQQQRRNEIAVRANKAARRRKRG